MAGLGLSFFFAFLSFFREAEMLVGPSGILPLEDFMQRLARNGGDRDFVPGWTALFKHFQNWPTLTWLSAELVFLRSLALAGMLAAGLLAFGVLPGVLSLSCWLLYLSVTVAGQRFFYFQWDNLLLETGLLAACLLPFSRWRALPAHFNGVAKTFWGFLLFKVILSSAMA